MLYHEFSPQSIGVKAALDREVWSRRPAIADLFRKALHDGGAKLPAIISGFWRLSRGDGRLNIHDFFRYRLFQPSFTEAERRAFISDSISWTICDRCSNPHWRAATEDKWLNSSLLKQCELNCPDILHVFDPSQRSYGNTPVSRNVEDLQSFLAACRTYPMFVKPNDQLGSFGASLISSFDGEAATLHDGTRLNSIELVSQLFGRNAYLFQPIVGNHPDLSPLTQKLATIRLINFVSSDGVFTPFAILKIATGDNIADNFWRAGNMLAQLDVDTGKIVRVVKGTGMDQVVMNDHAGLQLPMWQDIRQLNEKVARIFAPVAFNSLDVAVTPEGPTVIEVNSGSSFDLWQVASGTGFLQPDVKAFLASRGCFAPRDKKSKI